MPKGSTPASKKPVNCNCPPRNRIRAKANVPTTQKARLLRAFAVNAGVGNCLHLNQAYAAPLIAGAAIAALYVFFGFAHNFANAIAGAVVKSSALGL